MLQRSITLFAITNKKSIIRTARKLDNVTKVHNGLQNVQSFGHTTLTVCMTIKASAKQKQDALVISFNILFEIDQHFGQGFTDLHGYITCKNNN
jgi:hypothetical protein